MPIDDPISMMQQQVAARERETVVSTRILKSAVALSELVLRLTSAAATLNPADALSACGKAFNDLRDQWTQSNVEYLVQGLLPEVQRLNGLYALFREEQRQFLDHEWPTLVLKGIEESRHARSQQRLDRVIAILVHAGSIADVFSGDRTEEFISIALQLGDAEIKVLQLLYTAQHDALERIALAHDRPLLRPGEINEPWQAFETQLTPDQKIELPGICRRLESVGLVASVGGGVSSLPAYGPWSLLRKGKAFIEHLHTRAATTYPGLTDSPDA